MNEENFTVKTDRPTVFADVCMGPYRAILKRVPNVGARLIRCAPSHHPFHSPCMLGTTDNRTDKYPVPMAENMGALGRFYRSYTATQPPLPPPPAYSFITIHEKYIANVTIYNIYETITSSSTTMYYVLYVLLAIEISFVK